MADWKSEWKVQRASGRDGNRIQWAERGETTIFTPTREAGLLAVEIFAREGVFTAHIPIDLLRELVREHDERRSDG